MKSDVVCTIKSESSYIKAKDGPTLIQESIDSKLASAPPRLARTGIGNFFPATATMSMSPYGKSQNTAAEDTTDETG